MLHPLNLPRSVRDPIQGTVRLTNEEFSVVNHALFRRLHRIRQNGLLYLVFPSATHTRFEHSIGALQVADLMLQNLLLNSSVSAQKGIPGVARIEAAEECEAVDFTEVPENTLGQIFRITRLAALVHDLGHGPFSHTFDSFAPYVEHVEQLLREHPRLQAIEQLADLLERKAEQGPARVQHEDMSCIFFALIWDDITRGDVVKPSRSAEIPAVVTAVLRNKPEMCTDTALRPFVSLMHDMIASAPVDADRMDYLERDSRAVGVSYGLYDRNRLLTSMLVYRGQGEIYRLGFKRSGLRAVENFIQARFQLFVQVYYHKTNQAVERMLQAIAAKADALQLFEGMTLEQLTEIYLHLSDERFLNVLRGRDQILQIDDVDIHALANCIYDRRLWKRVFEGRPTQALQVADHLTKTLHSGVVKDFEVDPKATKDLHTGAALLDRVGAEGTYHARGGKTWMDESTVIAALAQNEQQIGRVYLLCDDVQLAKQFRNAAREYATNNQMGFDL